ncbi:hypothetical protein ACE6H2_027890 [Prunus campanulata]
MSELDRHLTKSDQTENTISSTTITTTTTYTSSTMIAEKSDSNWSRLNGTCAVKIELALSHQISNVPFYCPENKE